MTFVDKPAARDMSENIRDLAAHNHGHNFIQQVTFILVHSRVHSETTVGVHVPREEIAHILTKQVSEGHVPMVTSLHSERP